MSQDAQARSESAGQLSFPENWDAVDDEMGVRRGDIPLPQTPATPGAQAPHMAAPQPQRLFQTPQASGLAPPAGVYPMYTPARAAHDADTARSRSHGRQAQRGMQAASPPMGSPDGHTGAPASGISMEDVMRAITPGNE